MSGQQNWRTEVDALDYFQHQRKQMAVENRRPVIRKPSDLVGPGIASNAITITDFNDSLAIFDGYFGAAAGAANAPTSGQAYVGFVTSDSERGGMQLFYGMTDGGTYKRLFQRSGADASAVSWGTWKAEPSNTDDAAWNVIGATGQPAFTNSWANYGSGFSTAAFRRRGGVVRLKGVIATGTIGQAAFTLPVGYRPNETLLLPSLSNSAIGRIDVTAAGLVVPQSPSVNTSVSLDGVSFYAEQ